jgi:TetR/AcrR family transcriptional regulator
MASSKLRKRSNANISANRVPRAATRKRRGIGRPAAGAQSVGRDALIARTCEMLTRLPPNKITRAEVARHMNVDPSLIRYYFRDRSTLLVAAAERLVATFQRLLDEELAQSDMSAPGRLRARVSALLKLNITYPFFHRLMIDELVKIESKPATRFMEDITQKGVSGYSAIIDAGVKDGSLRRVNSAFLFLAVIGLTEFFVNGMPVLRMAMGKDFDERGIATRYRDFICELLLTGLKAK